MATTSVRMASLRKALPPQPPCGLAAAIEKLCGCEVNVDAKRRIGFDQTVTLVARLGVDVKQADQQVRGAVVLPNGTGKSVRVLVFAQGANAATAKDAGADIVGGPELAARIREGWMDFDVAIATPDMMGVVGPLGRFLGPRGLMPSPKAGTVTSDVTTVVREYKAGKVEFRADDGGNAHCVVGRLSFGVTSLLENSRAVLAALNVAKPQAARGAYFRGIAVQATMTPSVRVSVDASQW